MSFLSDLYEGATGLIGGITGFFKEYPIAGSLAKTAALGLLVNKVSSNVNKRSDPPPAAVTNTVDPGTRIIVPPSADQRIPVVYGQSFMGGIITEAVMTENNTRMTYVITICEKTGVKLSDNTQSTFAFNNIFWNDQRIIFDSSGAEAGINAAYSIDREGNIDYSIDDKVKVWCYDGNSTTPRVPDLYSNGSVPNAYAVVPGWDSNYTMSNLVFVVVQVNYDKDKGITGLPAMKFQITNSMTQPGDCLYDYMTNTLYGAGIDPQDIYTQ